MLSRVCRCNMFHCCHVSDFSSTSNKECNLSFLAQSLRNKRLLKCWVYVIRQTNLPLNRYPRFVPNISSTQRADIYTWTKIQLLFLVRPSLSSSNKRRKPAKHWSANLGDDPVKFVLTTVHSIMPWVNRIVRTIVRGASPRLAQSISSRLSSVVYQASVVAWQSQQWNLVRIQTPSLCVDEMSTTTSSEVPEIVFPS